MKLFLITIILYYFTQKLIEEEKEDTKFLEMIINYIVNKKWS